MLHWPSLSFFLSSLGSPSFSVLLLVFMCGVAEVWFGLVYIGSNVAGWLLGVLCRSLDGQQMFTNIGPIWSHVIERSVI